MFNVNVQITKTQVQDLLTSALEGGSNYWYMLETPDDHDTKVPYWERVFTVGLLISNGKDTPKGTKPEGNDPGYKEVLVNTARIQTALQLMQSKYPRHFVALVNDQGDAETGDVFLQLCVFGEVIYG
jgi:hypothetical protein